MPYIHVCTKYSMERPQCNSRSRRGILSVGTLLLLAALPGWGQSGITGLSALPSAEQVINRNQDAFAGSIPQGKATAETIDLTIDDALDRGLRYNLGVYLSDRVTEQTRAARIRALSDLMPVVNGSFAQEEEKL